MAENPANDRAYSRDHLSISAYATRHEYSSPNSARARAPARDRSDHANHLSKQIAAIHLAIEERDIEPVSGFESGSIILDVASDIGYDLPNLERKKADIRIGNVQTLPSGAQQATLVLPNESINFFSDAVDSYRSDDTNQGNPVQKALVEPIESIELGVLQSLWTDTRMLPTSGEEIWWECWCWPDRINNLLQAAARLNLRISEYRLYFPEMTVLIVYATRDQMQRIIYSIDSIGELRRASDSPTFYLNDERHTQHEWTGELIDRLVLPDEYAPYICILDSGVNREHALIEPLLSANDTHAYDPKWGVDDDRDHGTNMAGLALYGDLIYPLASTDPVTVTHRLESVKVKESIGFERTDPSHYGAITQGAIAIPESHVPERVRTFALALTNQDISGERASSWSSAIDQSAAGCAPGDAPIDNDKNNLPRRLILVSGGNVPDHASVAQWSDTDEYPIEDPAQAWNALTIGGFTDKVDVEELDLAGWSPLVDVGERSPYSRTSTDWPNGTPVKPELVFEAGNRAIAPDGEEISSGIDSLSLLTTGSDVINKPLESFWATSAATAQGARLSAMIQARYPGIEPELVRALMVHSAQWSPAMEDALLAVGKPERKRLLRCFGYGIPNFERAMHSATNDLALTAVSSMMPYHRVTGKGIKFCDAHFYELPWPTTVLEELANETVRMKVTLSYFIEPNPGQLSPTAPERYRSCGLRFSNKRAGESLARFKQRVNRLERNGRDGPENEADPHWILGSGHVSAGSLHSDVWEGPAVELADRKHLAITPVLGWWRERVLLERYESSIRYALVVSLTTQNQSVSLYDEIQTAIEAHVDVTL